MLEVTSTSPPTVDLVIDSPVRFHGFLFNQSGVRDMICDVVMAGVPQ
ncbi:MAG TPA: hypothetical protein VMX38_14150 [Verrucomicrobiae bacterium]|jgi:hypothetical protein|nr:hypothetical protein [Verrucomicrobiae bacterium]